MCVWGGEGWGDAGHFVKLKTFVLVIAAVDFVEINKFRNLTAVAVEFTWQTVAHHRCHWCPLPK